ncbi:MAG: hypothetical protein WCE64_09000 [Bacteroidales bacterium]
MFERNIITHEGLEVKISDHPNDGIVEILSHAVQGSEGGLRFQLQNIPPRIAAYKDDIRFISLYKKNRITGSVGACYRVTKQGELKYPSTFIRYLAFDSIYQSDIRWKKKAKAAIKPEKDDTFKQRTLELFSKPYILNFRDVGQTDKHIVYAFVESMNERSKNLVHQAGFEYVRSFLTVAFSRFSPKENPGVSRITTSGEKSRITALLNSYYRNYSFYYSDFAFYDDKYYVLKEGNEIIAGALAIPSTYRLYDMPGIWGWILMKVLPRTPYLKRLFRPDEFRHLVFDAVYCRKGREKELAKLFESMCASEGYNTGLFWLDDRSDLFDALRSGVRMGALNRLLNAKPGLVYVRFLNLTEKEKERFYDVPSYITGFDVS